ncbi:substrate-binding periplasmic protein [Ferviditalea candida]|uniref:ABC transporter substrate-binding protein n=1 Tax=Ferviditalea candida TaxID=3108399 RepID=A0ABU5ZHS7_9BACL|nr:ABC transporter substrate-binding protein [Paenibacillaceae bacterium T2]
MFFKKKGLIAGLAFFLVLTFALSACGGGANNNVLRVGVDDSYPPMEYKDKDGKTTIGFDVDVAKELAKRLGKSDVQFISNDWTGIFDALETDKFDVIISSVSINEDRQKNHSLTNPYIANKLVIVTNKTTTDIKSPEDLKGKKVGVQASTTSEDFCKDLINQGKLEKDNLTSYPLVTQPFMDLEAGRLDAVVVDIVVAKYYISNNKDKLALVWESPDAEPMALCFKKKDTELRDKANQILAEMQKDGSMKKISEKWFGEDVTANLK